ncbi:peptidase C14 [Atractiella rhizophila]|nr:peptidase C14 [Atractiella rhizophila]
MLMDKPGMGWKEQPTKENMINAMRWLVSNAQPNDSLFFHFSGHGGQAKDKHGDEEDGYDETIYPLDFENAGHIVDDELHNLLVRPLPAGCRLTAIFDCCHSGSALDLPYMYSTEGKIKEPNLLADAGQGAMTAVTSYLRGDMKGVFSSVSNVGKSLIGGGGKGAAERTKKNNTSAADVIMWSGCKDTQTSADTSEGGQATGAMSYAFISSLTKMPQQSYKQMLNTIRDELQGRYSQKPQLSASHPIDTNLLFII